MSYSRPTDPDQGLYGPIGTYIYSVLLFCGYSGSKSTLGRLGKVLVFLVSFYNTLSVSRQDVADPDIGGINIVS